MAPIARRTATVLLRCIFGGGRDPEATTLDDAALIAQAAAMSRARSAAASVAPVHASVVRWQHGVRAIRSVTAITCASDRGRSPRNASCSPVPIIAGPAINDLCADADTVVAEVNAWT